MSIETNSDETTVTDLDDFSADFFGQKTEASPPAEETEDVDVDTVDVVATNGTDEPDEGSEDSENTEDDTLAPDDDTDEEEEEDETPPEKPQKKNRFQERINEFTRELRETQRQLQAIQAENEALKQGSTKPVTLKAEAPEVSEPSPDAVDEDGNAIYPLGEYDPLYIRDITRHTFQQELNESRAREARDVESRKIEEQRNQLSQEWTTKLSDAQERYPDLTEKGENLVATFEGIDQTYGEYLSSTIMSLDYGPDVLYYLANNVDEAQRIVNLGPTKATIALGRIESKFIDAEAQKTLAKPRVSKAPTPPPVNKGSAAASASVALDTDDLDAFSRALFKEKKR